MRKMNIKFFSAGILTILGLFLTFLATPAQAAGTVINTNDSGSGSLRAAVVGGGTVTFNIPANSAGCTGTTCTITLTSTLTLPATTTINATTPANNNITIAGNGTFSVLTISAGGTTFGLEGLTISGGGAANGGGINYTAGGSNLTINNSTFTNNSATGNGGLGGAIFRGNNGGTVTITNSTFNANHADGNNAQGGAIYIGGNTNITNTTFSGNTNNGNNGNGGAIYVSNAGQTVNINFSTFTLNTSNGNSNNLGGGIFNAGATVNVRNTIIAGNSTTGFFVRSDLSGTFTSGGYNLIGIGNSTGFTNGTNNDQVGTSGTPLNAGLAGLANNGGRNQTHALQAASPAIDKGNSAASAPFIQVTTDERGRTRYDNPGVTNAADGSDIGAFEAQATTAASVNVGGRVTDAFGRGISKAQVSATNESGDTFTARTNPFGYYTFSEVQAGQTYTFTVAKKEYEFIFPTQTFFVGFDREDLNFIAMPNGLINTRSSAKKEK